MRSQGRAICVWRSFHCFSSVNVFLVLISVIKMQSLNGILLLCIVLIVTVKALPTHDGSVSCHFIRLKKRHYKLYSSKKGSNACFSFHEQRRRNTIYQPHSGHDEPAQQCDSHSSRYYRYFFVCGKNLRLLCGRGQRLSDLSHLPARYLCRWQREHVPLEFRVSR